MESILKSDIFFFITSVSVIFITIISIIIGFYFIKILRNFYKISVILKTYTEDADSNLRELGEHIRSSNLLTFFFGKEKSKKNTKK